MKNLFFIIVVLLISTISFAQEEDENVTLCDSNNEEVKKLYALEKYEEAIKLALITKDICLEGHGVNSESYLIWINYMSVLHMEIGEFKKALDYLKEEKKIREELGDLDSVEYGTINNNMGMCYKFLGEYDKALKLLVDVREQIAENEGKENEEYARVTNNLALVYGKLSNYEMNLELLEESKKIRGRVHGKKSIQYSNSLNNIGILYSNLGEYEKAIPYLLESLKIKKKKIGEKNKSYANALNNLAIAYYELGEYGKSFDFLIQSSDILKEELGEENIYYINSQNNIALSYANIDENTKAKEYLENVCDLYKKKLGVTHPKYADAINNLSSIYRRIGDLDRAMEYCLKAKDILGNKLGEEHPRNAFVLNNGALIYTEKGEYNNALEFAIKALDVREKYYGNKHPAYAKYLGNLANTYRRIGEHEKALPLIIEEVEIIEARYGKEHIKYGEAVNDLAAIYRQFEDYDKAIFYYDKALELRKKHLGTKNLRYAITINNIASIHRDRAEYDKAILKYTEAMDIKKEILGSGHPSYANSLTNLAYVYKKKKEFSKALNLYNKAIKINRIALGEQHPSYTRSLDDLAIFYHGTNEIDQSIDVLIQSLEINQTNIHEKLNALSEDYMIKWIQKNKYLFNLSHSLMISQYSDKLALETYNYLLATKSIALERNTENHLLNFTENNPAAEKIYTEYKKKRREYLSVLLMTNQERKQKKLNLNKIEREINDIEVRLAIESKSIKSKLDKDKKRIRFDDVVKEMKSDEVILDFHHFKYHNGTETTDSIIYTAYLIFPESKYPIFIPLAEEKDIKSLLKESIGNSSGMSYVESQETGQALYELIFAPLEKHLKGIKTIHISASGVFHKIAFHALENEGELLMDIYDIHYLGTTRDFIIQRMNKNQRELVNKNIALFGNPDFNASLEKIETVGMLDTDSTWANRGNRDGFNPLPQTKIEIENIEAYAKKNLWIANSKVELEATEGIFKSLSGQEISVIHLATHGYALKQSKESKEESVKLGNNERIAIQKNPLFRSGIVLSGGNTTWKANTFVDTANDGLLTAYEISMMNLSRTNLVVLSACETGLGDVLSGEGVIGLQRAFKTAGVKNLIVSLWKVDDKATRILMEKFYKHYFDGKEAYQSLLLAQQEMREGEYSNSKYWAGFILIE